MTARILAILDDDVVKADPSRLGSISVELTMSQGRVVFSKDAAVPLA